MAETILRSRALQVARKKFAFRSTKPLQENLSHVAETLADAYLIGAEEAQETIVERLALLKIGVEPGHVNPSQFRDLLVQVAVYFRDQEIMLADATDTETICKIEESQPGLESYIVEQLVAWGIVV